MDRNGKRGRVCKQVRRVVSGFPSKAPGTKAAYLAAFATFAGSGVLTLQLVDLFNIGSLRCTAIGESYGTQFFVQI